MLELNKIKYLLTKGKYKNNYMTWNKKFRVYRRMNGQDHLCKIERIIRSFHGKRNWFFIGLVTSEL